MYTGTDDIVRRGTSWVLTLVKGKRLTNDVAPVIYPEEEVTLLKGESAETRRLLGSPIKYSSKQKLLFFRW